MNRLLRHVYRFTCKPNYSVVSKAELVYVSHLHPCHFTEAMTQAKHLAREQGISYVEDMPNLDYIGEIELTRDTKVSNKSYYIITAISGEY